MSVRAKTLLAGVLTITMAFCRVLQVPIIVLSLRRVTCRRWSLSARCRSVPGDDLFVDDGIVGLIDRGVVTVSRLVQVTLNLVRGPLLRPTNFMTGVKSLRRGQNCRRRGINLRLLTCKD